MFGILNLYGDRTHLNQYYSILKLLCLSFWFFVALYRLEMS
jgi:hypothetical protein